VQHLNTHIRVGIIGIIVGAVIIGGCAKPSGSIKGKVSYKGVPLKGGKVLYYSTEDESKIFGGPINEDGTFEVLAIAPGTYKVCIDTSSGSPVRKGPPPDQGKDKGQGDSKFKQDEKKDVKPFDPKELKDQEHGHASNKDVMKQVSSRQQVDVPQKYRGKDSTDITFTATADAGQTHEIDIK